MNARFVERGFVISAWINLRKKSMSKPALMLEVLQWLLFVMFVSHKLMLSSNATSVSDLIHHRTLAYKLPEQSPLVGQECLICFEEFESGIV